VHRVEFRLRAPVTAEGRPLGGGVRVYRSGLLIGDVTFRVHVSSAAPAEVSPDERFVANRYRKIFASYSRRDRDVVQLVADYVETTGDRYLVDVQALRSGERWEEGVEALIREADVFQLFWSRNSMTSTFVREEWEYALALGRDAFVRPVYWEVPMPRDEARGLPPPALAQLHFGQLPLSEPPVPAQAASPAALEPEAQAPPQAPPPEPVALVEATGLSLTALLLLAVLAVAIVAVVVALVR
jgi:hypothetical protein